MAAAPRGPSPLDLLDQTINDVLVYVGRAVRSQANEDSKLGSITASAARIKDANIQFNEVLDSIETDIVRAKAVLLRELENVRVNKAKTAAASSTVPQAPAALMDIDTEEPPSGTTAAGSVTVAVVNGSGDMATAPAGVVPFLNMDVDVPAIATTPMQTSPVVDKERSPQWTTKPAPTPGMAPAGPSAKKPASPVSTRVVSPASQQSTASPVAINVPLPPAVKTGRPTPTPINAGATNSNTPARAISVSSSSSSPVTMTTSPVVARKNAAPERNAATVNQATSPAQNLARAAVPSQTTPALPAATTSTAAASAPPSTPGVPAAAMDGLFDLSGPRGAGEDLGNAAVGYADIQHSLVPADHENGQPQAQPTAQPPPPPRQQQQSFAPPAPQSGPAQPQQLDDSEFDVEKFAADAAQNLLVDSIIAAAPAEPSADASSDALTGQAATMGGTNGGGATGGDLDTSDDLFKYMDDNMEAMGDTTTNFDELYGTDTVDIDDFFD